MKRDSVKANIRVYDYLRERIVNLELLPGQEINMSKLTEEMGFSRSPVRDALLRLEEYRLVDIFPQSGTRVSFLNIDLIRQERFMRSALELHALEAAIKKERTPLELEVFVTKLKSILLKQKAALLSEDYLEFFNTDDEMHHLFYSETGLEQCWNVLSSHTGNERRIRILSYKAEGIVDSVLAEHTALIEHIENKDIEGTLSLDRKHLSRLTEELEILKEQFPQYFK